ncbi:MAG: VanZ family protein [Caldilineaceae bacterium]
MHKTTRYWLLSALWMGVIFVLSHQPKAELAPAQPSAFLSNLAVDWNLFWQIFFQIDWDTVAGKGAHVVVYGVLAFLLWQTQTQPRFVLCVAILYACSDELHQIFIPGRTPKLTDVLFDSAGVLMMLWWLTRNQRHPDHRNVTSIH